MPAVSPALPVVLSRSVLVGLALLLLAPVAAAQTNLAFADWLDELRTEARDRGFSEDSIELAFSEITAPEERIIANDRSQPETVQTYEAYLGARVSEWRISNGRKLMVEHADLLARVAAAYGVQPRFLVAVWGMETNFGTYPLRESAFNVLATLAFDRRRADFFRAQFFAALTILDNGFAPYDLMKSSWAGALGQSQFIPESYLAYAVDFDGDGKRDIWTNPGDVLASIANYFAARNWQDDQTWGRQVLLPPNSETALMTNQADGLTPDRYCRGYQSLGAWRDLQEWQALGVRRADGTDLPTRSLPAALVVADTGDNEGYLVYRNFCSIMSYNPAFKYALAIGLLADALAEN